MWYTRFWVVLLFGWASSAGAQDRSDLSKRDYDTWVQRCNARPKTSWFHPAGGGEKNIELPVMLRVIAVEEEREGLGTGLSRGCDVATTGQVRSFVQGGSGTYGGYRAISETDRQRLEQLLKKLPDDNGQLPPPGRCLIVQAVDGDHSRVRIYDRANAPDLVWEVLRTSTCRVRPWVLDFKSESTVELGGSHSNCTLALSPDGLIVYSLEDQLVLFDPTRREALRTMLLRWHVSPLDIKFSPNGSLGALGNCLVDARTWEIMDTFEGLIAGPHVDHLICPQFTADGRYLLYLGYKCDADGRRTEFPRAYYTKTWKKLDRIPGLPEDALRCIESPNGKRAIVLAKGNSIALWNRVRNRQLARLDDDAQLHLVAFSPDESMVAVATGHRKSGTDWTDYRIRIWAADSGKCVHELFPLERRTPFGHVRSLLWTKQGDYVIADENIWNITSGRHRGTLSPILSDRMGTVMLPDGRQLAMGGTTGDKTVIQFWDFVAVLKDLHALEESFAKSFGSRSAMPKQRNST